MSDELQVPAACPGLELAEGTLVFLHPFLMVRADPASEHKVEAALGHKGPDETLREQTGFR